MALVSPILSYKWKKYPIFYAFRLWHFEKKIGVAGLIKVDYLSIDHHLLYHFLQCLHDMAQKV